MTVVDTSAWIDHFRKADRDLVKRLHAGAVLSHPFVVGELAMGAMRRRREVIGLLQALPTLARLPDEHSARLRHAPPAPRHRGSVGWMPICWPPRMLLAWSC